MAATSGDGRGPDRAGEALRLLVEAARRAPVPDAAGGAWHLRGPLLLPVGTEPDQLPPGLAALVRAGRPVPLAAPLPRPSRRRRSRPARPHAVLLSRIATDRTRLRSFPLGEDARPVAALTVHSRRPLGRGRLQTAARTQRDARRTAALRVPEVLGAGRSRGGEWLAEEYVDGRHLRVEELAPAAAEVAAGLARHWGAGDVGARVHRVPQVAAAEVEQLLGSRAADEVGAAHLAAHLRALGRRDVPMAVGPCHGDPVPGNVLRSATGDLVLLDWEHAGPGVLARDLVKVVLGVPAPEDGDALLAAVAPGALAARGAGWRDQVALTLVQWLAGWRQQEAVHGRSGRAAPFQRRLRRRLSLLRLVLEG